MTTVTNLATVKRVDLAGATLITAALTMVKDKAWALVTVQTLAQG